MPHTPSPGAFAPPAAPAGAQAPFAGLLGALADAAQIGLWDWDLPSGLVVCSPQWERLAGCAPGEGPRHADAWMSRILAEDLPRVQAAAERHLHGASPLYEAEYRLVRKDKSVFWAQDRGAVVEWDEAGAPRRLGGVTLDISRLKETQGERAGVGLPQAGPRPQEPRAGGEAPGTAEGAEAEPFSRAMFFANPHANILFDEELRMLDCNPAAVRFFGYSSKEELLRRIGPEIIASIPPLRPDGVPTISLQQRLADVVRLGQTEFEAELFFRGSRRQIAATFIKVPHKDGFAIVGYVVDLSTVNEAKGELMRRDRMLEQVNRMAAELMTALPEETEISIRDALQTLGRCVRADRVYMWRNFTKDGKLFARQIHSWAGGRAPRQANRFEAGLDYDLVPNLRDLLSAGLPVDWLIDEFPREESAILNNANTRSLLVIPVFLQGQFWGFVGFEDCTEARRFSETEGAVLKSGSLLAVSAALWSETTQNLIAAREEAEENARAKAQFLSRMSHEIRTPMNAIIGMTAVAKNVRDFHKIQQSLDKIDGASQQLLSIINDILDMSKIESGKFELTRAEFDFEKMLHGILARLRPRAEENRQHFHFNLERPFTRNVVSDELRLSQVIANLLSNALKFTPCGGDIRLLVRQIPRNGSAGRLHVEVRDSGIGVDKEQMDRLFQSFEQADGGLSRRYGGAGLGLTICKHIVELMGGSIWVDSEMGKGSTFAFEVDIAWGNAVAHSPLAQKPRQDLRILVADGSDDAQLYFQSVLQGFGLSCVGAACGEEALAAVRRGGAGGLPFDIIFLDWHLPGLGGGGTARAIQALAGGESHVVAVSAGGLSDIESEAGACGVAHFLSKPVAPSTLYDTIVTLSRPLPADGAAPPAREYHWKSRHILLVEDIEINRDVIIGILADTRAQITCAANGREAVEIFEAEPQKFDIILMDVQMPELDGIGATRRIRASAMPGAKIVPIVAMTANAFKEDVESCLAAGMNDHVAKPIDIGALMDLLDRYFSLNLMHH